MIYFLLFLTLQPLIINKNKEYYYRIIYFVIFIIFLIVLGTRTINVGIDTANYYKIFNVIHNNLMLPEEQRWEPLYRGLNLLVSYFNGSAQIVILIAALITLSLMFLFFYKASPYIFITLILYLTFTGYFFAFNGIRQALSISFISYGFLYYLDKKNIKFTIFFVIACLFHYTSIFFLTYFIFQYFKRPFFIFLIWLLSLFLLLKPEIYLSLLDLVSYIVPLKFQHYLSNIDKASFRFRNLIDQLIFLFIFSAYSRAHNYKESHFLLLTLYGILIGNIFYHVGFLARLSLYFYIFLVIAIPISIRTLFTYKSRIIVNCIVVIIGLIFLTRAIILNSNGIYPYTSWLIGGIL